MGAKAEPDPSVITLGGSLMHERKPDFSGYVTRAGLKCSDGRTIMPDAFKHQDKTVVPLVWQHGHDEPGNVIGHTLLENREDGVYGYGFFNDGKQAQDAKIAVEHDDIKHLSIYANRLVEKAANVLHGFIREVSLVMAGANPGAFIDNISIRHGDGSVVTLDDEVIITTPDDIVIVHGDEAAGEKKEEEKEEVDEKKAKDVYDSMTEEQQVVVHYLVGTGVEAALAEAGTAEHSDKSKEKKGTLMSRNVFEQAKGKKEPEKPVLSHDDVKGIIADAQKSGSLKDAIQAHALKHGIENIEVLFPDAKSLDATPQFDSRRVEWVSGVLNACRKSPFSRVKTTVADITQDEARAKGYIKGNMKKEEWFGVSRRTTGPSTVYKKQKLDRDDIVDIVDFDVVIWMKGEMRVMLDEELARAVLIGDGREVDDEDKIKDPMGAAAGDGIRSILNDHDLFVANIFVNVGDAESSPTEISDAILMGMTYYKGSGGPTLYTTLQNLNYMLLARDQFGHRLWKNPSELASELGVSAIVTVEVMEAEEDVFGIIVNLKDYTLGADKGGEVTFFDDFDIDYNQYKYLYETRLSGGLTKIRSAIVVRKTGAAAVLVVPVQPSFDKVTGVMTVPTVAGVTYKDPATGNTLTTGSPVTLDPGESMKVVAEPASANAYFADDQKDEWTFKRNAS